MELVAGKVYLRDTRNGRVHPMQSPLCEMGYMTKFVAGMEAPILAKKKDPKDLTAEERAAEADRRAGLNAEQRAAEDAKNAEQKRLQDEHDAAAAEIMAKADAAIAAAEGVPTGYAMTDKVGTATYQMMLDAGWTFDAMIEHGMLVKE